MLDTITARATPRQTTTAGRTIGTPRSDRTGAPRPGGAISAIAGGTLLTVLLAEVAGLVAFAVWGAQAVDAVAARWALGIGAPLAAALLWGRYCAPKARVRLPRPAVAAIKLAFLGAATLALLQAGHPVWAAVLLVVAPGSTLLARALPSP